MRWPRAPSSPCPAKTCWRPPLTCNHRAPGGPTAYWNGRPCCAGSRPNSRTRTIPPIGTEAPGGIMPRLLSRFIAAGMLLAALVAGALAQDYPNRPVRLIVPFPPGGSNDVVGRLVAMQLSTQLGQQVFLDNPGGA